MKSVEFSETVVACNMKAGRCRQLIELMKVYGYSGPWSLANLKMKIKTCFSHKPLCTFNQILFVNI